MAVPAGARAAGIRARAYRPAGQGALPGHAPARGMCVGKHTAQAASVGQAGGLPYAQRTVISSKLRGNFDEIKPLCFQNRGALAL